MRILTLYHKFDLEAELARVGADPCSWSIFADKREALALWVNRLSTAGANILKQTALACGADCAVHRDVASGRVRHSDAVLFGTRRQLLGLCARLASQPECVARLVPELRTLLERASGCFGAVRLGKKEIDLGARTFVMGTLNVTPDSFFDGGRFLDPDAAFRRAMEMEQDGADFIDIGAESTRPGARPVAPKEQLNRLLPVLRRIQGKVRVPISVDTTSATVARAALDAGAQMVNDISGLAFDENMARVLARTGVPCVVMHIQGKPRTMQRQPKYRNLMQEVIDGLDAAIGRAVEAGVRREQVIVDPGIGFGKRLEHNLEILRRLSELRSLGRPILVGPSRKSFIGAITGLGPEQRLEGTLAATVLAAVNGANILRVHDVKEAVRALRVADAITRKA